jgi:hypothetical protein
VRRSLPLLLLGFLLVAGAVQARERQTITVRMPRVSLPPGSDVELCYFARIPATDAFLAGSWQLVHAGARGDTLPQHGLVYLYVGERLGELPSGQVVQSRACLDLGPVDRDRRVLFASGSARKVVRALPSGVALELAPVPDAPGGAAAGIGILLDVNWANGESRTKKVSSKLVLRRAPRGRVKRVARPLVDESAGAGILVPPFARRSTAELVDARWTAGTDSCVLGLSGQMHRRGRCVGVDLLDTAGVVKPPTSGIVNPCEPGRRAQLFAGVDFTDPGALAFTTPFVMRAGEALRYACWTDNGASAGAAVRLGCEETPGVVPGAVGEPAAPCTVVMPSSPECGGSACTYAAAVAGTDADDERCALTALVYDAAPGGGCDVSGLP